MHLYNARVSSEMFIYDVTSFSSNEANFSNRQNEEAIFRVKEAKEKNCKIGVK